MSIGRVMAAIMVAGLMNQGAQAQQILTTIGTDDGNYKYNDFSASSGELLSNTYLGTEVRALTQVGVNKAYASSSNGIELSATSAWLDSYTLAASSSPVTVTFNFSIDGTANFGNNPVTYYNFHVLALRNDGWTIQGSGVQASNGSPPSPFDPLTVGSNYDEPFLQRLVPTPSIISQLSLSNPQRPGVFNYQNVGGVAGAFTVQNSYDPVNDVFHRAVPGPTGMNYPSFYADRMERRAIPNGPVLETVYYAAGTPNATGLQAQRKSLEANYAVIGSASLCIDDVTCNSAIYELGTQLSLSFQLAGGSTFSIAAILVLDELESGLLDFFNTAKVSSITAVDADDKAVALINPDLIGEAGNYGYAAASTPHVNAPAVPEPATWAMMIGGFALAGGALRGRARRPQLA